MRPFVLTHKTLNRLKNLLFSFTYLLAHTVCAQVSIDDISFVYGQDFDSLTVGLFYNPWSNGSTLAGWYAISEVYIDEDENIDESYADFTQYKRGDGSSSSWALYSFGSDQNDPDRALGTINQNDSQDIAFGLLMTNNTGATINSITLSYTAEQWRRVDSSTKGYQAIALGYQVSNDIDASSSGLLDGIFIDLPEGNLLSSDTTTLADAVKIDGNDPSNQSNVSITFPLSFNHSQELFIRFYDPNVSGLDAALAIDDLTISFSTDVSNNISATTEHSIFSYLEISAIQKIPSEDDGHSYIKVSENDYTDLESLFSDFYSGNHAAVSAKAQPFGYVLSLITADGTTYEVLRKENTSAYFWGTFVNNTTPTKACMAIEAPHPIKDAYTGSQAAWVFNDTGSAHFIVSGMSRCTSTDKVKCAGTTTICSEIEDENELFRISDPAHNDSTAFHLASVALNNSNGDLSFVQLHGFGIKDGDPHIILSNGSIHEPSGTDHIETIENQFIAAFPSLDTDAAHIEGVTKLKGTTNVFGRYLNNYEDQDDENDNCTSSTSPSSATGSFLHIEQYKEFRRVVANYAPLSTLLGNSISCGVALPITFLSFEAHLTAKKETHLTWQVMEEYNVERYEVERSNELKNYKKIGQLNAQNISQKHDYSFIDSSPLLGTSYYQIKEIDFDGHVTILPTRVINNIPTLHFYPNPTRDWIHILGLYDTVSVRIIGLDGTICPLSYTIKNDQTKINIEHLPKGLYILEIDTQRFRLIKI